MLAAGSPPQTLHLLRLRPKTAAFLPSPRPRSRRKNHLGPKLPKPLCGPFPDPPTTPHFIVVEEEQLDVVQESVGEESLRSLAGDLFPVPVLGLALRFAALVAVQTVVAVLFLGWGREEGSEARGWEVGRGGGKAGEFETKVVEIRRMAREARERERQEFDGENRGEGNASGGLDRTMRRRRPGINGLKIKGANQQIDSQNYPKEPGRLNEPSDLHLRESNLTENFADLETSDVGLKHISNVETVGTIAVGNEGTSDHPQDGIRKDISSIGKKAIPLKNENKLFHSEKKQNMRDSSTKSKIIYGRTLDNSKAKETKDHEIAQNNHYNVEAKPWWLKLPYVLGIFLRRGTSSKGLYSLRKNPFSEDEDSPSYTIAFQDRGDATNFCYLLESFFEDLPEFSADLVPLTTEELEEAVKFNELKLLVVRKGQLQLYAGQPLAEVETALFSLFE